MITYYRLIIEDQAITVRSRFYKVKVGAAQSDQRAFEWLQLYVKQKGYYLQKQGEESDCFLFKIATSLGVKLWQLPMMLISATDLYKHIADTGSAPAMPPMTSQHAWFYKVMGSSKLFEHQNKVIQHAEANQRKKPKVHANSL